MDEEERKEVVNEVNKIYDVKEVFPSIYLATELSRSVLVSIVNNIRRVSN